MATQNYQFSLPSTANCSAGVYNASGVLIRTLFSIVSYNQGIYTLQWDGNDDFGNAATGGPFTIKVESSNTIYTPEGVLGNTSDNSTGSTVLRTSPGSQNAMLGIALSGTTLYWALGYSEQWPGSWYTSTADLNTKTWIGYIGKISLDTTFVCTDGTTVYWGAFDSYSAGHTGVYGTLVSGNTFVTFSSGTSYTDTFSTVWSLAGYSSTTNANITGLAVQQTHNYLFVCRATQNQVLVLNKSTGAVAQTITTITSPGVCCVDTSDNVWIADSVSVKQYSVNSSTGVLTATGTAIALTNVGGLSASSDGTTIAAADMTNQLVKGYSASAAVLVWTIGSGVSYETVATVANNKFYWQDARAQYSTFLCYMADGSILIGDSQNYRVQRFQTSNQTFVASYGWQHDIDTINVDPNNPTRIFCQFGEYNIPLNNYVLSAATLVNNWGGNYGSSYDTAQFLKGVVTLSNGHTYARVRNGGTQTVVELVAGGAIRYTGLNLTSGYIPIDSFIDVDGSRVDISNAGAAGLSGTQTMKRYELTGFDSNPNPLWSSTALTTTSVTVLANNAVTNSPSPRINKTSNGNLIFFDPTKTGGILTGAGTGYHIGAVPENTSAYIYQGARTTAISTYIGPFPGQGPVIPAQEVIPLGWFDSGNLVNYPGASVCVNGQHVIWGYHGEGWKNTQTNVWTHIDDNTGLIIGQFGAKGTDFPNVAASGYNNGNQEAPSAAMAGNALCGELVSVNGNLYLYHGDEQWQGGTHRWHITGLNTLNVQEAVLTTNPVTPLLADLHSGLTAGSLATGNGWTVQSGWNPTNGNIAGYVGTKTYDNTTNLDVDINGGINNGPLSFAIQRSLGNAIPLYNWKLSGLILMDINIGNTSDGKAGINLQVLDVNENVIVQIFKINNSNGSASFMANSTALYTDSSSGNTTMVVALQNWQQYSITVVNGTLTVSWGNTGTAWAITETVLLGSGSIWQMPTTLQILTFNNDNGSGGQYAYGRSLGVYKTIFQGGVPLNNI
jgi:hypothetical protein